MGKSLAKFSFFLTIRFMLKAVFVIFCSFFGVLALRGQDFERQYVKAFPAPAQGVMLDVARGMIEVLDGPAGSELKFEVTVRVQKKDFEAKKPALLRPFEARAREERLQRQVDEVLARLEPRYKSDAKRLAMEVRDPREVVFDSDPTLQAVIEVKVTIPEGLNLTLRGVETGITIQAYQGSLDLKTEAGSYFVKSVSGDFYARTFGGSVTIGEVGGSSDIRSEAGTILAGRLHGPAKLGTSNGSIEVQQACDTLHMRGDDSDLILGVSRPVPKSLDIATSVGRIILNVDTNVALSVDASSAPLGSVKVRGLVTDVRKGGVGESRLQADLLGGGKTARLRTSGGTIQLIGREPLGG
jgi:hypothetical protein